MLFMSRLYPKNIAVRSVTDEHLLSVRVSYPFTLDRGKGEQAKMRSLWRSG